MRKSLRQRHHYGNCDDHHFLVCAKMVHILLHIWKWAKNEGRGALEEAHLYFIMMFCWICFNLNKPNCLGLDFKIKPKCNKLFYSMLFIIRTITNWVSIWFRKMLCSHWVSYNGKHYSNCPDQEANQSQISFPFL